MSDATLTDWFVPLVSWSALVVWVAAARLILRLRTGPVSTEEFLPTLAAVLGGALALALSSLSYPDLIPPDWARFLLLMGRVVFLVTGLFAWAEARR